MRELMDSGRLVFTNQMHRRICGHIEASGSSLAVPAGNMQQRVSRIICAIKRKNEQFYVGTDTLLGDDEPANFEHLVNLHREVRASVQEGIASNYIRVFVVYGKKIKRAK